MLCLNEKLLRAMWKDKCVNVTSSEMNKNIDMDPSVCNSEICWEFLSRKPI